jgi:hypothetical protein
MNNPTSHRSKPSARDGSHGSIDELVYPKMVNNSDDTILSKITHPATDDANFRHVHMGATRDNGKHASNNIRTSKYSVLSFAPKSLLMQFFRAANIYFLIISILTVFDFSPKNPISMIGTFVAVLVFTMIKEAYEDYFRHKSDRSVNGTKT